MPSFADRYQSVLVPVIFEPWAEEVIRRAAPCAGEDVLDLGCGTGVVARALANVAPGLNSLTGVDHSAEMLGVARDRAVEAGLDVEWVQADAAQLPFADDSFDVAICQQALQFFPDRSAALRELLRVMRPGGRVFFSVQRGLDVNPMLAAQAAALDATVGIAAGDAVRAICGLPDAGKLQALFEGAGFAEVEVVEVTLQLHHPDARAFATGAMGGMHTGDKLASLGTEAADRAVALFIDRLGACFDGTAMEFPHASHVVTARA